MGILNSFVTTSQYGPNSLTETGASALNQGLNIANPFLSTGAVNKDVWNGGSGVGTTGFSSLANAGGQIAGQFGVAGAGIQGGLQAIGAMTDLFAYNPEVSNIRTNYGSNEIPTFDLSDEASATNDFMKNFSQDANKKVASSALGGAAAGTAIAPGIGTAIGGAIGLIGGLLGRKDAHGEAVDARNQMRQEYSSAISKYNTNTQSYYNKQAAYDKYMANAQSTRNMFGIPSASPYFYLG